MAFTFTVEDGTGLPAANAYVDVAFCDDHHAGRGRGTWIDASTDRKQEAIVRATDYIDARFGRKFRGTRKTKGQGLEWPRLAAYDDDDFALTSGDEVPRQLKRACAEYALRALVLVELAPDPAISFGTRDTTGAGTTQSVGDVAKSKKKVGPIEKEVEYRRLDASAAQGSRGTSQVPAGYLVPYPQADLWLEELLVSSQGLELVRG